MDHLRIRLFGGLEVCRGNSPLPALPTRRARSLLAYLVLHRDRPVHRDLLCGLLWGEHPETEARKALRTTLWRIRSVLEPREEDRGSFLRMDGPQVTFPGTGGAWVDALEFEASVERRAFDAPGALSPEATGRLYRAVSLYQGDLLDGVYDDWCNVDRERFSLAYLGVLERLMNHHQFQGQWLAAISFGRQLLRKDPIREHVHRQLMICHLSMGDRPSALRQYEACVRLMREELGVEPMEETQRLHDAIRDRGVLPRGSAGPLPTGSLAGKAPGDEEQLAQEVDGAVRQLHALIARLEAARAHIPASVSLRARSSEGEPPSRTDPPTPPIQRETLVHEHR
jgi:DNA-binding SARP family transcriptional activator